MKCNKCGNELRIGTEQVGIDQQNLPIIHRFGYCDHCMLKSDLDIQNVPSGKKKDSALSIWACVLSILSCTAFIGFILAIIDLCKNDKSKRHIGSWFSIVFFCLLVLVGFVNLINPKEAEEVKEDSIKTEIVVNNDSENNVEEEPQEKQDYYTDGMYFESGDLKITINSSNLDFTDYDDEYGWYTPEDGMKYISVSFTYENIGDSDAYVSIYDYECYADGTLCEQTYYFGDEFINANLSSGRNTSFETFYIVPIDAEEIELEYSKLISFDDEKIIIKLK